jgi:hypothetical protein
MKEGGRVCFGNWLHYITHLEKPWVVMNFFFSCLHIWDTLVGDLLYIIMTPFYSKFFAFCLILSYIAPWFVVWFFASLESKNSSDRNSKILLWIFNLHYTQATYAQMQSDKNNFKPIFNKLIFVILEDVPQVFIQMLNNVLLGRNLSMIQCITPVTGFLSAIYTVNMASTFCFKQRGGCCTSILVTCYLSIPCLFPLLFMKYVANDQHLLLNPPKWASENYDAVRWTGQWY